MCNMHNIRPLNENIKRLNYKRSINKKYVFQSFSALVLTVIVNKITKWLH
jgi:hypothetical protein